MISFLSINSFRCLRLCILLACILAPRALGEDIPLAGQWQVSLTGPDAPDADWKAIVLPGTLDDAGIGTPALPVPELDAHVLAHLQRKVEYTGKAWFRREIEIPASWANAHIALELERVLWRSTVFIDGKEIGSRDSLTTPHTYDLTGGLAPGRHTLTVCVDNSEIHPGLTYLSDSFPNPADRSFVHAYTNHTQIIWNGLLGKIVLRATAAPAAREIRVFARQHPAPGLRVQIKPAAGQTLKGSIALTLARADGQVLAQTVLPAAQEMDWDLSGVPVQSWDEFNPVTYRLEVVPGEGAAPQTVAFGFRDLASENGSFMLNGQRIFLRGTLECCIFPLTGYPPTDVESWKKIMRRAKEWGLNHLRFHSWCPPAAAFAAADETGVYLLVELPHWNHHVGENRQTWDYLQSEAERILSAYGNHPSFMFMSLGNELRGDVPLMEQLTRRLQSTDPRRLYTAATYPLTKGYSQKPGPEDEFFVTRKTPKGWIRGEGIFNTQAPAFEGDYRNEIADIAVPIVSHEIGQYAVYPDLSEISRYTGNLVPVNFIAVRNDLAQKGLLALAPAFTDATGRFAALLYKEDIERALRTPQMDGFQLLGLQDFPGQGTALVGLLNAFWEPKGAVSAAEFRQFCGPLVPLARIPRAVWNRGETIPLSFEVANYWKTIPEARLTWHIRSADGKSVAEGRLGPLPLPEGQTSRAGSLAVPVPAEGGAAQWTLSLSVDGTDALNEWKLWVYPSDLPQTPAAVHITDSFDEALARLEKGETVILNPPPERIQGVQGRFLPVFWSPFFYPAKQSGTMGIVCDPAHPALAEFPTQNHSDWQWWDLALRSRSVVIDGLPVQPIVRVVDNFKRNHSLALVFEAKVGPGKLIFCAADISADLEKRPTARQLRRSLAHYAASPEFLPQAALTPAQLRAFAAAAEPAAQVPSTRAAEGYNP